MCVMCLEIMKQQMSLNDARRNLGEVVSEKRESSETLNHYRKLKEAIEKMDIDELTEVLKEGQNDLE